MGKVVAGWKSGLMRLLLAAVLANLFACRTDPVHVFANQVPFVVAMDHALTVVWFTRTTSKESAIELIREWTGCRPATNEELKAFQVINPSRKNIVALGGYADQRMGIVRVFGGKRPDSEEFPLLTGFLVSCDVSVRKPAD
jgi:hypothetical protein